MNILITGGASGLGEAITKTLAKNQKNKIYFTFCKSRKKAKIIEEEFNNSYSIKCDFKNSISLKSLLDNIHKLDIDVLINNAYTGDFLKYHFHKTPSDIFLQEFKDNVIPTVEITQACINTFRKKKMGKIITVLTSALSNFPPIGSSVYIANKAYLEKLTKIWANENAKFNISSNSISPSFMQTNLTSGIDERVIEQIINNHPLKKLVTIEEVAETVEFLITASKQINGIDIIMNAGVNN